MIAREPTRALIDQGREEVPTERASPQLARTVLATALGHRVELAEVFLKEGRSFRCEFGPLAISSLEQREESGIAIRIWKDGGREGFVHSDAPRAERIESLVALARAAAGHHPGGPLPRLPRGPIVGTVEARHRARAVDAIGENELLAAGRALAGAFSAQALGATRLIRGWVEWGETESLVMNSLGREAASGARSLNVGLVVGPSGAGSSTAALASTLLYRVRLDSMDAFTSPRLAEEASWRVAASFGGEPVSARTVPVALEPRAAASWIRWLLPRFGRGHTLAKGAAAESSPAPRAGLDLTDDPGFEAETMGTILYDGEGREVMRREILKDGLLVGRFASSADPEAPDEEIGPMRRDSFRDPPSPGPMRLVLAPGKDPRDTLLARLAKGLLVTSLVPYSAPGSNALVAEVRGVWIEDGMARRPVARTLLMMPSVDSLSRVIERGSDLESDDGGPTIAAPTLVIDGIDLIPM